MPFVKHLGKTNMLTHIPQDIKLELKNGVLTLKAGSKVYVPNGFEKVTKYYKDVVTTKYWKEVTTGSKELEYACYKGTSATVYWYAKVPLGSDYAAYMHKDGPLNQAFSSDILIPMGIEFNSGSITEDSVKLYGGTGLRYTAGDLYIDTTVTETVEGTPEDYTYTTTETETIEVSADDDWTRSEEVDTDIKKFDEVRITADKTATTTGNNGQYLVMIPNKGTATWFDIINVSQCVSGTTDTLGGSSWHMWYDTANNQIKWYGSDGAVFERADVSLPIALVTVANNAISSIDQVFNGFGYIGSTVYALPNVKGLIPDGWNEDGTLRSIEFTTNKVSITNYTPSTSHTVYSVLTTNGIKSNGAYRYDTEENYVYDGSSKTSECVFAITTHTPTGITSFTPKKVGEGIIKNKLYQLAANKRTYYKYVWENYSLPKMTSNTTPEGKLTYDIGIGGPYATDIYPVFFGGNQININGLYNQATRYLRYTFAKILKAGKYTFTYVASRQNNVTNNLNKWEAILEDDSRVEIMNPTITTSLQTFTAEFEVDKPIKAINLTLYASAPSEASCYYSIDKIALTGEGLAENTVKASEYNVLAKPTDYDYYTDKFLSYAPIVRGKRTYYKQSEKQRDTGTYTFTLDKEYTAKLLFVGNGGGGCSSQKDSQWWYASGGSGACFEGTVRLPADTYTLTIGTLGYGNNSNNVHWHSGGVESTDSYLTNSAGEELIRVGCGAKGNTAHTSTTGGVGGVLTLGTLDVIGTKKAVNGNQTTGNSSAGSLSAYDGTYSGYGAGTCGTRGAGNVYGIAGIFDLVLETDINDFDWYVDVATKIY